MEEDKENVEMQPDVDWTTVKDFMVQMTAWSMQAARAEVRLEAIRNYLDMLDEERADGKYAYPEIAVLRAFTEEKKEEENGDTL